MSGLYVVTKSNDYFKQGDRVREFDDGFEKAYMRTDEKGKQSITGYTGIVVPVPKWRLQPYMRKILKQGMDHGKQSCLIVL